MSEEHTKELEPCPFCGRSAKIEAFHIDDDPQWWYVATCVVCPVKTYDQFSAQEATRIWNSRASVAAPQKDLRIYDREGNVVTQGALNALMAKVDSLTEDAELAAEDADRLRGELGTVYANMLRAPASGQESCPLCGHERRFYNPEADACEHTTGLTKPQFDVFCGCACRFAAPPSSPVSPSPTPEQEKQ